MIFRFHKFLGFPTPPDRGPFIKEVTGHYLTLSWIPTKRAPPRYPQVTYVIEIRELPEKEWRLVSALFWNLTLRNEFRKPKSVTIIMCYSGISNVFANSTFTNDLGISVW